MHFIMQRREIEGVLSSASCMEVEKYVLQGNLGVERVGVSSLAESGVDNDVDHKLSRLPSRRFICSAVGALGFVCRFGARIDNGISVASDVFIVGPDSCRIRNTLP